MVVKPEKFCLFGANIVPVWVFRKVGNDYKLALKTHSLNLNILQTKTNGYRDISVAALSAAMIFGATYKFDGQRYVPRKCYEKSMEKAKSKITYFKCSENPEKPYR